MYYGFNFQQLARRQFPPAGGWLCAGGKAREKGFRLANGKSRSAGDSYHFEATENFRIVAPLAGNTYGLREETYALVIANGGCGEFCFLADLPDGHSSQFDLSRNRKLARMARRLRITQP